MRKPLAKAPIYYIMIIMKKTFAAAILILLCAFALSACTTGGDERIYVDVAEGKFGDALGLSGGIGEDGSLTRTVTFDTRLEGWHYLGISAKAGEPLYFTVPEDKAAEGLTVAVDRTAADGGAQYVLSEASAQLVPDRDGIVEIWLGDCSRDSEWSLTVTGGYSASYYRLGIDPVSTVSADGIVDGANVRLYAGGFGEENASAAGAARWWRSLAELIDRFTGLEFGVDYGTPLDIFVGDFDSVSADTEKNAVLVPSSRARDVLDHDSLVSGSAWDVIEKVAELKLGDNAVKNRWITALCYVLLTDNAASGGGAPEGIGSGYECLKVTFDGCDLRYASDYLFANLMHSFGAEKASEFILAYDFSAQDIAAEFYTTALEVFGVDCSGYMELFGLSVPDAIRDADAAEYVPVQSSYALGANADNATGTVVKMGESTAFDLRGSVLTSAADYEVAVSGGNGAWEQKDGLFYYTPEDGEKDNVFVLEVTIDGTVYELPCKLTYDAEVAGVAVYEDVPYRDIDEAVSNYEDDGTQPAAVFAIDRAGVESPEGEADESVYTLAVGSGSLQVEESGVYEIHLKSRGVVRVDFGVPKYMFTMFRNSLTIDDYFGELYYELELEEGVVYDYKIYVLGTKGDYFADLGIRPAGSGEPVEDIGKDMLIYGGYDKSGLNGYEVLEFKPRSFDTHPAERVYFDIAYYTSVEAPGDDAEQYPALSDNDPSTVYTPPEQSAEQRYSLTLATTRVYFAGFDCLIEGLDYVLYVGQSEENAQAVASGKTVVGENSVEFESRSAGYIGLVLSSDEPFGAAVCDIYTGVMYPECNVVPSDSSQVFYQGKWERQGGVIGVNGVIRRSYGSDAAVEYSFRGSYVAVYCAVGPEFGNMRVYLDGMLQTTVDLNADENEYGVRVFAQTFASGGEHTLRLVADTSDDIVNLDFIGVIPTEADAAPPEYGNLYYLAVIPAVLAVVFAICVIMDVKDRRKRRAHNTADAQNGEKKDEEDGE